MGDRMNRHQQRNFQQEQYPKGILPPSKQKANVRRQNEGNNPGEYHFLGENEFEAHNV